MIDIKAVKTGIFLLALVCGCGRATGAPAADAGVDLAVAPAADLSLPPVSGPMLLSQTGLYGDFASRTIAPGIFSYAPRYPLWADGAEKTRYLRLPPGTRIDTSDLDNWVFPVGTKVWKEFRKGGVLVETRLLYKVQDGSDGWWRSAYVWNADGSDAVATVERVPNAVGTTHDVPSQVDCVQCHAGVSDTVIGVSAYQLSSPGGSGQLTNLAAVGLLSNPPGREYSPPGAGVVQDALGYLHGNCGHCHNSLAFDINVKKLKLRLLVADADLDPTKSPAYATAINVATLHVLGGTKTVLVPGQPDASQLYYRMSVRSLDQMPPVCTKEVDVAGVQTIRGWILGL